MILLILLLILVSCQEIPSPEPEEYFVVEARIESGEAPVVLLSTSIVPTAGKQAFSSLGSHVERWARVAISDGEREVVLTGMPSSDYFPPYIYTTGRMFGQAGKSYTLTVDTDKYHCTASTSIPDPVALESLEPVPFGNKEGEWAIRACFRGNPAGTDHYKFYTRIRGVDSIYVSSLMSMVDDAVIAGPEVKVMLVPAANMRREESRTRFRSSETVDVKLCTMDDVSSEIMKAYDAAATYSGTPIMVSNKNIPGNVSGALGYFVEFGTSVLGVDLP